MTTAQHFANHCIKNKLTALQAWALTWGEGEFADQMMGREIMEIDPPAISEGDLYNTKNLWLFDDWTKVTVTVDSKGNATYTPSLTLVAEHVMVAAQVRGFNDPELIEALEEEFGSDGYTRSPEEGTAAEGQPVTYRFQDGSALSIWDGGHLGPDGQQYNVWTGLERSGPVSLSPAARAGVEPKRRQWEMTIEMTVVFWQNIEGQEKDILRSAVNGVANELHMNGGEWLDDQLQVKQIHAKSGQDQYTHIV